MPKRKVLDFIYEKESYGIRGSCFNVYNALGGGIKEKTVERALVKELQNRGFVVGNQIKIPLLYRGEPIGTYIPDIIVNSAIILELKSKPFTTKEDKKQFCGYLKESPYKLGFLVNFGSQKLAIERFVHTKKQSA